MRPAGFESEIEVAELVQLSARERESQFKFVDQRKHCVGQAICNVLLDAAAHFGHAARPQGSR